MSIRISVVSRDRPPPPVRGSELGAHRNHQVAVGDQFRDRRVLQSRTEGERMRFLAVLPFPFAVVITGAPSSFG